MRESSASTRGVDRGKHCTPFGRALGRGVRRRTLCSVVCRHMSRSGAAGCRAAGTRFSQGLVYVLEWSGVGNAGWPNGRKKHWACFGLSEKNGVVTLCSVDVLSASG